MQPHTFIVTEADLKQRRKYLVINIICLMSITATITAFVIVISHGRPVDRWDLVVGDLVMGAVAGALLIVGTIFVVRNELRFDWSYATKEETEPPA